jgi:hypothetical protein
MLSKLPSCASQDYGVNKQGTGILAGKEAFELLSHSCGTALDFALVFPAGLLFTVTSLS